MSAFQIEYVTHVLRVTALDIEHRFVFTDETRVTATDGLGNTFVEIVPTSEAPAIGSTWTVSREVQRRVA